MNDGIMGKINVSVHTETNKNPKNERMKKIKINI
jgi:cyanate lyase